MNPKIRLWIASLTLILMVGVPVARRMSSSPNPVPLSEFATKVDLSPLRSIAVQDQGRFKSFNSFANYFMAFVSGPRSLLGQPDEFSYIDLMVNPDRYSNEPIVYVKQKPMRVQIARALGDRIDDEREQAFIKSGLIAPADLLQEQVQALMGRWSRDLIRTAKHVDRINGALSILNPGFVQGSNAVVLQPQRAMVGNLRILPPATGDEKTQWVSTNALFPSESAAEAALLEGFDGQRISELRQSWTDFVLSWRASDAQGVNTALATFCANIVAMRPDLYPSQRKLSWESWYFSSGAMTWVWLVYLLGVILLITSVAYRWPTARISGMGVFGIAFTLHTFALGLRWYVSGRWPNSNMFEAVTTAVWFGALAALLLEVACRKTPLRNLFALTASCASMFAMMAAHFLPELDANINNRMPILHDIWLYIHTNVIIASYALIAMAAVTGTLYVLHRIGGGAKDFARAGGAASLLVRSKASFTSDQRAASKGEVFDGATMILMELAFVMLWAGIVMGAIWADHSWGRPWGWDPKEVFALNTFIVFLVLVHVRLKVKDKGLWTALLAVLGCAVMMFNWIVINFVISGLHSYA